MSIGRTGCSINTETGVLSVNRFLNSVCYSLRLNLRIQVRIFSTYYFAFDSQYNLEKSLLLLKKHFVL
jgi:hypothetical protein